MCREYLFQVDFMLKPGKQKFLIEILVAFWGVKMASIALLLGVSQQLLEDVLCGQRYLDEKGAHGLVELFAMTCGS